MTYQNRAVVVFQCAKPVPSELKHGGSNKGHTCPVALPESSAPPAQNCQRQPHGRRFQLQGGGSGKDLYLTTMTEYTEMNAEALVKEKACFKDINAEALVKEKACFQFKPKMQIAFMQTFFLINKNSLPIIFLDSKISLM